MPGEIFSPTIYPDNLLPGVVFGPDKTLGAGNLRGPTNEPRRQLEPLIVSAGTFTLNVDERTLNIDGKIVDLTPIDTALAKTLIQNAGVLVSKEELLHAMFADVSDYAPDLERDQNLLYVHMCFLRRKMEPIPKKRTYIRTIRGQGYILDIEGKSQQGLIYSQELNPEEDSSEEIVEDAYFVLYQKAQRVVSKATGKSMRIQHATVPILAAFLKNPGAEFSLVDLLKERGETENLTNRHAKNTIPTAIRLLRLALEQNPKKPEYIHTIREFGYCYKPPQSESEKRGR